MLVQILLLFLVFAPISEGFFFGSRNVVHDFTPLIITLGPHENASDFDESIDPSHRELLRIAKTTHNFKEVLGFNWTGMEIMCNCSSSFCGTRDTVDLLTREGHPHTCIGQTCYHQKRYYIIDGTKKREEHWGCIAAGKGSQDEFYFKEQLICNDRVNNPEDQYHSRCCKTGFCHSKIADFPFPGPENLLSADDWLFYGFVILIWLAVCCVIGWNVYQKCRKRIYKQEEPMVAFGSDLTRTAEEAANPRNPYQPMVPTSGNQLAVTYAPNGDRHFRQLMMDLDSSYPMAIDSSCSSQLLLKNTASNLVRLEAIGQGKYGQVVKCTWRGQMVAAKILNSRHEHSFYRELVMYTSSTLRHTNVLQYLANGFLDNSFGMDHCLLFEYHEKGSLDQYLREQTISVDVAIRMVFSIASGISFLHEAVESTTGGKFAMAHRDIKSGNFLVKNNLMLCIADLGLSVCHLGHEVGVPSSGDPEDPNVNSNDGNVNGKNNDDKDKKEDEKIKPQPPPLAGTMRYLAPELLNETWDFVVFEAYKAADMYASSLVMYEIARRTETDDERAARYDEAQPFFRQVREAGGRPGSLEKEMMIDIVVNKRERPDLSEWWNRTPAMKELARIMQETWAEDPHSRLTASYIVNAIKKLAAQESISLSQC